MVCMGMVGALSLGHPKVGLQGVGAQGPVTHLVQPGPQQPLPAHRAGAGISSYQHPDTDILWKKHSL